MEHPNCTKCKHYQVSWDPNQPRGCKLFQFKSKQSPAIVVFQSTGNPCSEFSKRQKKPEGSKLNNPEYW